MNNVTKILIKNIDSFNNHPFYVRTDETIKELSLSIKENGLINPVLVRIKNDGRYEMISGHRRKLACEMLGYKEINAIVEELSDDEATIFMVDSNMYRDKIFPSEKAFAYKMKYDAIKHQGKKTLCHNGAKLKNRSDEKLARKANDSARQIQRFMRLTYLIPDLLKLVDNSLEHDSRTVLTMGLLPAVELSYLNKEEQQLVYSSITYNDLTPSHSQAIRIRELSKTGKLNYDTIETILNQIKGNQKDKITFNKDNIISALPIEMRKRDKKYIEQYIIKAINSYQDKSFIDDYDKEWEKIEKKLK